MQVIPIKRAIQNIHSQMSLPQTETRYPQMVKDSSQTLRLSKQNMAWLWIQMSQIYGPIFINRFGANDNGIWFEALKDLTPKALESGMERLGKLTNNGKFADFPPNCFQFRAVCLGFYEDLKLPKAGDAYREIKNRNYLRDCLWSHPVIKFIASKLPRNFLEIRDEKTAYALFKKVFDEVCDLRKQGYELPEAKENLMLMKQPNRKLAQSHLAQMKQILRAAK